MHKNVGNPALNTSNNSKQFFVHFYYFCDGLVKNLISNLFHQNSIRLWMKCNHLIFNVLFLVWLLLSGFWFLPLLSTVSWLSYNYTSWSIFGMGITIYYLFSVLLLHLSWKTNKSLKKRMVRSIRVLVEGESGLVVCVHSCSVVLFAARCCLL